MSVVPDLLLKPAAAEAKPKTPSQASPAATQPRSKEPSSFAKVYERERQAKSNEPAPARTQSEPGRKSSTAKADSANEMSPAEAAVVAADGNVLPVEATEGAVDPLLLLGLGFSEGEIEGDAEAESETEEAAALTGAPTTSFLATSTTVDAARIDPEMEKLSSAAAVKLAVELDASAKRQAAQSGGVEVAALTASSEGEEDGQELGLDSLLSATLESSSESGEKLEVLVRSAVPEVTKDTPAESRGEAFAGRLSALAQQMNPQLQASRAMPMVPGQPVPMQQGGWSEAVVDRVMWLSSQNLKSAEIQLDPAELGRLEVRISMNQDVAQVTFASANPNVRDALESQMHRLRELFSQQGMGQLDVNVSDQSLARGQGQGDDPQARRSSVGGDAGGDDEPGISGVETSVSEIRADRGLVDYYA